MIPSVREIVTKSNSIYSFVNGAILFFSTKSCKKNSFFVPETTEFDEIAHQTVTVKNEVKKMMERGLKEALRDRDDLNETQGRDQPPDAQPGSETRR